MEGNHALRILALDARAAILAATDDTLETEPLRVDLGHPDRCLRCNDRARNPIGTAEMDPLIQGLSWWYA